MMTFFYWYAEHPFLGTLLLLLFFDLVNTLLKGMFRGPSDPPDTDDEDGYL
jgi:hypothetical protein